MRDTTREWASWSVPLLVVAAYLSWVTPAREEPAGAERHRLARMRRRRE